MSVKYDGTQQNEPYLNASSRPLVSDISSNITAALIRRTHSSRVNSISQWFLMIDISAKTADLGTQNHAQTLFGLRFHTSLSMV